MNALKKIKLIGYILAGIVTTILFIAISLNWTISDSGNRYIFNKVDSIPHSHCALVLGTSKYLTTGKRNQYYTARIEATIQLFNHHKIDYIIVSGDNRKRNYNEPITMYNDLIVGGIPAKRIILDYAGFRTLDSVVRAKEVFGQLSFTIVSQSFHNQRALYIAKSKGINAIAFNADQDQPSLKIQLREFGARMLMFLDMVTAKQPHFLGEKVIIPEE